MKKLRVALACSALVIGLATCATKVPATPDLHDAVAVSYHAIPLSSADKNERRVGQLVYRGGLEITSSDARFGGWSGLMVAADGKRMLSQSDEAHWFRADLVYDGEGNLVGVTHAELADMLDMNGKTMPKKEGDAEGLAALTPQGPDGAVAISFERDHRIWKYDLSQTLDAKPSVIPTPPEIKSLDFNSGLEGLTEFAPHMLFTVAETAQDHGAHPAWLISDDGKFEKLDVVHHEPYEISDAAMGPDGNLYLLERHYFGPVGGVVAAVREIDRTDAKPSARLDGHEIAKFTMRENIDNMEGLALRRDDAGHTFLYMISDDNYNHPLQRTVLLMFEIVQ